MESPRYLEEDEEDAGVNAVHETQVAVDEKQGAWLLPPLAEFSAHRYTWSVESKIATAAERGRRQEVEIRSGAPTSTFSSAWLECVLLPQPCVGVPIFSQTAHQVIVSGASAAVLKSCLSLLFCGIFSRAKLSPSARSGVALMGLSMAAGASCVLHWTDRQPWRRRALAAGQQQEDTASDPALHDPEQRLPAAVADEEENSQGGEASARHIGGGSSENGRVPEEEATQLSCHAPLTRLLSLSSLLLGLSFASASSLPATFSEPSHPPALSDVSASRWAWFSALWRSEPTTPHAVPSEGAQSSKELVHAWSKLAALYAPLGWATPIAALSLLAPSLCLALPPSQAQRAGETPLETVGAAEHGEGGGAKWGNPLERVVKWGSGGWERVQEAVPLRLPALALALAGMLAGLRLMPPGFPPPRLHYLLPLKDLVFFLFAVSEANRQASSSKLVVHCPSLPRGRSARRLFMWKMQDAVLAPPSLSSQIAAIQVPLTLSSCLLLQLRVCSFRIRPGLEFAVVIVSASPCDVLANAMTLLARPRWAGSSARATSRPTPPGTPPSSAGKE